jgi:hypothetical protein
VFASDIDGDGDFTRYTVDGNFDAASCAYAGDVDGDGDQDVLGAAYAIDSITWWENLLY